MSLSSQPAVAFRNLKKEGVGKMPALPKPRSREFLIQVSR
jgi:hypothetical protein